MIRLAAVVLAGLALAPAAHAWTSPRKASSSELLSASKPSLTASIDVHCMLACLSTRVHCCKTHELRNEVIEELLSE